VIKMISLAASARLSPAFPVACAFVDLH